MGDETRSLVDAEWEKFERGIVRPGGKPSGAMSDPEADVPGDMKRLWDLADATRAVVWPESGHGEYARLSG
jgi:hypothetical protein